MRHQPRQPKARFHRQPSEEDLAKWAKINNDLLDWLYTGLTGSLQIRGHKLIDQWAAKFVDRTVLEVGCGHGHHLLYGQNDYSNFIGLDIEYKFVDTLRKLHPGSLVLTGNAYHLPLGDNSIDCVLSMYNFEHLRDLPTCLREIRRVLKPDGELLVGLPAEGGLLYSIGRRLTSTPYMTRKYGIDYEAIVHWEHWNTYREIVFWLKEQFTIERRRFIPFAFTPWFHLNAIICLRAFPRP
jgi:SAM-dependent methyltransferase